MRNEYLNDEGYELIGAAVEVFNGVGFSLDVANLSVISDKKAATFGLEKRFGKPC